jgi:2-haloacid dehalogenase
MNLRFDSYEVLVFDCYGTIIDWETGILNALQPIFEAHDLVLESDRTLEMYAEIEAEIEAGTYQKYSDVLRSTLSEFGRRLNFNPTEDELDQFSRCVENWPPFPDSKQALDRLQSRYKLVILSNVDDDLFGYSRQKLGIEFYRVYTAQQIRSYKPSLRNFEFALNHLGIPRDRVLHVAQSLFHDIRPAKQLGLATVWVNRRKDLQGSGATPPVEAEPDCELSSLGELVEVVGLK